MKQRRVIGNDQIAFFARSLASDLRCVIDAEHRPADILRRVPDEEPDVVPRLRQPVRGDLVENFENLLEPHTGTGRSTANGWPAKPAASGRAARQAYRRALFEATHGLDGHPD